MIFLETKSDPILYFTTNIQGKQVYFNIIKLELNTKNVMIRNFHYIQLRIDDHNGFKFNPEENSYFHANEFPREISSKKFTKLFVTSKKNSPIHKF